MLHREAVPTGTLDLLINLSRHPALEAFSLVGGTSLALRLGHRQSEDLDFFTTGSFDPGAVAEQLGRDMPLEVKALYDNGFSGFASGVKVDFVTYRYPLLSAAETMEGIRLASLDDVSAMKLSAIINRGAKKDFYDLHALIARSGLASLIEIHRRKYSNHDPMILLRSLCYFDDAEPEIEPLSLTGTSWEQIKRDIVTAVRAEA